MLLHLLENQQTQPLPNSNKPRNLIPRHHQNTSQANSYIYKKILIQPNRGSCRLARLNHILGPVQILFIWEKDT